MSHDGRGKKEIIGYHEKKPMSVNDLFIIVPAGGSGTRFWPVSREQSPEEFMPVFYENGRSRSMFGMTMEISLELAPAERIRIVTTGSQMTEVGAALFESGARQARLLEVPAGGNTAPALGLAAFDIISENPDAVVAVLPPDHCIRDRGNFKNVMAEACAAAREGWIVTLGIKPAGPGTGCGYINRGRPLKLQGVGEIFTAERYVGKTGPEEARQYASSGEHYRSSGIFIFKAAGLLSRWEESLPTMYKTLEEIRGLGAPQENKSRYEQLYSSMEKISIEDGIMCAKKVAVIPADIGWRGVGSWKDLHELLEKDAEGNIIHGDAHAFDTRNSLVWSSDRLVAALGLDDAAVVETADAVLVCPLERSRDIRAVAEGLIKKGRPEAVAPRKVDKPWGAYMVLDMAENYQVKWLDIKPGQRLSLQSHECRSEHWTIVAGTATVTRDDEIIEVPQGSDVYIPRRVKHRVENRGEETLRFIEVQTGSYLGEDDIVRYEDDYGRAASQEV